jgi:hypothetical protein
LSLPSSAPDPFDDYVHLEEELGTNRVFQISSFYIYICCFWYYFFEGYFPSGWLFCII